jgi:signal transduction histidine kinase/ligand-binding sensor domain-containing protein
VGLLPFYINTIRILYKTQGFLFIFNERLIKYQFLKNDGTMRYFRPLPSIIIGCLLFASCTEQSDIPFPKELSETVQPEAVPLELTAPQPLRWDTVKRGAITPTVFRLDFSKMKGMPYDSRGFKPLTLAPKEVDFDFALLPSKTFDISKVPELELKMILEPLPETFPSIRASLPKRVTASSLDLQLWESNIGPGSPLCFIKDHSGFLWIGTTHGLFRFDGTYLENVRPKVRIGGLNMDNEGRIWFTSSISESSSLIGMVDIKKGITGIFQLPYVLSTGIPLNRDTYGALWVVSFMEQKSTVIKFDPGKMIYQAMDTKTGFTNDRYYEMVEDRDKNIWLSSYNGIDIILKGSNKVVNLSKVNGLSSDSIRAMTQGPDGRIWVSWPHGVDAVDLKRGKITGYRTNFSRGIRSIKLKFDKEGQLWQGGVASGISLLNINNNTLRNITDRDGLEGLTVADIFDEGNGRLLISTLNADLVGAIYIVGQYGKTVYPFGNESVYTTVEDSRGHLWIGTNDRLYAVDSARQMYWRIDSSHGLANNFIQNVTNESGDVVITTMNGYNVFNAEKNEFLRYSKREGLLSENTYNVMTDAAGHKWFSTEKHGIYKYDPFNKLTVQLTKAGGLGGDYAIHTLQMKNGNVWVMTSQSPALIDLSTNSIQSINNHAALSDLSEKIMLVDSQDRIWFGSASIYGSGGLFMLDKENETISKFSTENGLSNNIILSILEHNGKIIVGTSKKVNIISPPEISASKKWEINILKGSDNLVKVENSYISDAITKRGNYIWGDDGMRIIYGIESDTSVAKCFIKGVDIMAQPIYFSEKRDTGLLKPGLKKFRWDSLAGPYFMPQNLRLPYNENVVKFYFSEMSTGRTDTTTYAYILEGLDKKWVTTKDDHTQTYLNLSPGNYTLKVRSKWTGGRWSEPAQMSFTIHPPWYNTWWAYLMYVVGGALLIRLYLEVRSRKLKKENKILEEKVKLRTKELQQSYNNVEQLGQIGRKITSSLSVEKIIRTAYKNVNALMDASVFGIGIYNAQNETLDFPATLESDHQLPFYTNSIHDKNRFGVICFNSGMEIIMHDLNEQYKHYLNHLPDPHEGAQPVSLIYLPLSINEKKLGVITVQSFKKNAYSENHLNMLRNIATYTAIALENAESFAKLNQSLAHLKEAQSQLVQSVKMASLGELTAGIAHEIQNPLNFVNNFSDVNTELIDELNHERKKNVRDFENEDELLKMIKDNEQKINHHGKRADAIVKGMLQHSRKSTGVKEPTNINALSDEYLRLSYHGLRAKDKSFNAIMKTDFDESIGSITIIPQDIGRVILNLFNNAFYAVTEKKKQHPENYEPTVSVATKRVNGIVEISVKDNGSGIPQNALDKLFQPFFTTKPTGEGTGLGLSLSYDIIKAHGGTLRVETSNNGSAAHPGNNGSFTIFTIALPVHS